ncbi:MAG: deoxynucleoside kinase [Bacillota bacterium]
MHISIEGFDGVGKSTVSKLLAKKLGFAFVEKPLKYLFDNHGGDSEYIRIRNYFNNISEKNRALSACFYSLGNLYLYEKFKDQDIITDRHILSNFAWSYGEESLELFDTIYNIIGSPKYTFILYGNKETIIKRLKSRNNNDADLAKINKHETIYKRMEFFANKHNMDYLLIDTSNISPKEIVDYIIEILIKRGIINAK